MTHRVPNGVPKVAFPFQLFQKKWQMLKVVPQGTAATGSGQLGSVRVSDLIGLSTHKAVIQLTRDARDYMGGFPGLDEAAKNHLMHKLCKDLSTGKRLGVHNVETGWAPLISLRDYAR